MQRPHQFQRKKTRALVFVALCIFALAALIACRPAASTSQSITFITDPGAQIFQITQRLVREFEAKTGHRVRLIRGPARSTERLSQYLQYLGARSPDIDIYQVDVIWPAMLQNHLLDLTDTFTTQTADFAPAIIRNNTVDGRLLAIPWYVDLPLLYYRTDLLHKHGYAHPPVTWDELTTMAAAIQDAERASGNSNLWGFVWQGRAYEGLTCNALEWQVAENGGTIVAPTGQIQVNTPGARHAFTRAAGWVNTISPPGVTMYSEEEARQMFQAGNAIFMRNWPYAYSLVNSPDSPVAGNVKVAPLPAGASGHSAATLGGWQLAVSKYSRHKTASIELVRYLTSARSQALYATRGSYLPTRMALYDDPEIATVLPFLHTMRHVLDTAVARPSRTVGQDYNEVSTYYFQYVHQILSGQSTAADSMAELDTLLHKVLDQ